MNPTTSQPSLADLMSRYLQRRLTTPGNEWLAADLAGDVVPYEAAPVQPVDGRLAWEEGRRVLPFYHPQPETPALASPPQWAQVVAAHEPVLAVPFCAGNFPQLVRSFQPLLQPPQVALAVPAGGRPVPALALVDWAREAANKKQFPQTLLALGALRLARQFDTAAELLRTHQVDVPAEWRAGWANEAAALAWHQGQAERAYAAWQSQAPSVPVLFNRGMAALFLGKMDEARTSLSEAVSQLADAGGWDHLGRLYLAMSQPRARG
jgi:hypothetical protein